MRFLNNHRRLLLFVIDLLIMLFSGMFVFITAASRVPVFEYIPGFLIITAAVFTLRWIFRIYSNIWRYAETEEYLKLMIADFCGFLIGYPTGVLFLRQMSIPLIYILLICMISLITVLLSRFVYRQLKYITARYNPVDIKPVYVAVIGAGYAGMTLVSELKNSEKYIPYCFFDSDSGKKGKTIHGIKVIGSLENITETLKNSPVTQIAVAIPSISGEALQSIIDDCSNTGCEIKLYEYPMNRMDCTGAAKAAAANVKNAENIKNDKLFPVSTLESTVNLNKQLRNINIEDLLARKPIKLDLSRVKLFISGKTILITGGGGSIGSELCRQIAKMAPGHLTILDIYENNAYDIQQELKRNFPDLSLSIEIASVRDGDKVNLIFEKYKPDIVFHAAAHKHVPLMEDCPDEAIKNNVFGTYNVCKACNRWGVSKMVLISTDKAVNPTNIMGATKRICEMIIQSMKNSNTEYAAVRFGNVLGSNGSVIPLFKKQIEKGGPVTITDKRIIRYFMTIPEAVELVLQAGVMAAKSEIFVLDMGEPVKIYDLALKMIKLSGLVPGENIEIKEIGLRPGEKLYEELLVNKDTMTKTDNQKIFIEHFGDEIVLSEEALDLKLDVLKNALKTRNNDLIKAAMMKIVPAYKSPEIVNTKYFEINYEKSKINIDDKSAISAN